MIKQSKKKIGLVLSGGGAKGAYHIGMFAALEHLGLAQHIKIIAGCSIGAFNAALYATGNTIAVRKFMHEFGKLMPISHQTDAITIEQSRKEVLANLVTIEEFAKQKHFCEYDIRFYKELLLKILPDEALLNCKTKLKICAYSIEESCPKYFELLNLSPEDARNMILASGSLPFIFPPVKYLGTYYLDGGVIPPFCTKGAPADKIPVSAMLNEDIDILLINFLIASDTVDTSKFPKHVKCVEMRPSKPLEKYPGEGTLNFSAQKLAEHEKLGYEDTIKILSKHPAIEF